MAWWIVLGVIARDAMAMATMTASRMPVGKRAAGTTAAISATFRFPRSVIGVRSA